MKEKILAGALGICLIIIIRWCSVPIAPGVTSSANKASTSTTQWQYEIAFLDDFELKKDLEQAGKAGWEIASTRRATNADGMFGYEIIYKRKVQ